MSRSVENKSDVMFDLSQFGSLTNSVKLFTYFWAVQDLGITGCKENKHVYIVILYTLQ